jgi:Phage integrase family
MAVQDNEASVAPSLRRGPWNKGKLVGAKPPLQPKHVWSIRTKLQIADRKRDLAMFNLAIDSKLRGCDVVALKVEDIAPHGYAVERATVRQKKTGVPVRFEVTEHTRQAVDDYIRAAHRKPGDFLFAAPRRPGRGLSTRQYARLVGDWIRAIGLDPCMFGTHSLRRTKATLIAGQQAVVTDAVEAGGQHVHQEAPDELVRRERHGFPAARTFDAIVLPAERHATVNGGDEPAIGDGDAVGVARQIGQHGLRSTERMLGIDHPIALAQRRQIRLEGSDVIEAPASPAPFRSTTPRSACSALQGHPHLRPKPSDRPRRLILFEPDAAFNSP